MPQLDHNISWTEIFKGFDKDDERFAAAHRQSSMLESRLHIIEQLSIYQQAVLNIILQKLAKNEQANSEPR